MKYLMVKDYAKHQHYRNRNPVWIKLYNAVMDDEAFLALPDAARSHLILIWLLASRRQNKIPDDAKLVARAIQASGKVSLTLLADAGFLLPWDASTALAASRTSASADDTEDRGDDSEGASLEGEREKETKREEKGEKKTAPPLRVMTDAEAELAAQCGEHYPPIAAWLDARPAEKRDAWAADLLGIIGPATGNLPEDLSRGCRDGHLAEPAVTNARTLRIFVASCREERVRGIPSVAGRSPASRSGGASPGLSARDEARAEAGAIVSRVRALVYDQQIPGQGFRRLLRLADVEALGPAIAAAVKTTGGIAQILKLDRPETDAKDVSYYIGDFAAALAVARREADQAPAEAASA